MAIRDIQAEAEQRAKMYGNQAKEKLGDVGDALNAQYEKTQEKMRDAAEKVADKTQKRPLAALGIALACGIIIGKLL